MEMEEKKQDDHEKKPEIVQPFRDLYDKTALACFIICALDIIEPFGMTVRELIETAFQLVGM